MPQLKPETISMTGLNLFQHLCNLARLATSTYDGGSNSEVSLDPARKFFFFLRKGKTYIAHLQLYLSWEHTGLKIVYWFEALCYSLLSSRQYGFLHWEKSFIFECVKCGRGLQSLPVLMTLGIFCLEKNVGCYNKSDTCCLCILCAVYHTLCILELLAVLFKE